MKELLWLAYYSGIEYVGKLVGSEEGVIKRGGGGWLTGSILLFPRLVSGVRQ